jgi:hypothetical protein
MLVAFKDGVGKKYEDFYDFMSSNFKVIIHPNSTIQVDEKTIRTSYKLRNMKEDIRPIINDMRSSPWIRSIAISNGWEIYFLGKKLF